MYRWTVEEHMSFKKPGIPDLLKKEGLGKGKKTQMEKRIQQNEYTEGVKQSNCS